MLFNKYCPFIQHDSIMNPYAPIRNFLLPKYTGESENESVFVHYNAEIEHTGVKSY